MDCRRLGQVILLVDLALASLCAGPSAFLSAALAAPSSQPRPVSALRSTPRRGTTRRHVTVRATTDVIHLGHARWQHQASGAYDKVRNDECAFSHTPFARRPVRVAWQLHGPADAMLSSTTSALETACTSPQVEQGAKADARGGDTIPVQHQLSPARRLYDVRAQAWQPACQLTVCSAPVPARAGPHGRQADEARHRW